RRAPRSEGTSHSDSGALRQSQRIGGAALFAGPRGRSQAQQRRQRRSCAHTRRRPVLPAVEPHCGGRRPRARSRDPGRRRCELRLSVSDREQRRSRMNVMASIVRSLREAPWQLWTAQIFAVVRIELKKILWMRRSVWIYLIAFGPAFIIAL